MTAAYLPGMAVPPGKVIRKVEDRSLGAQAEGFNHCGVGTFTASIKKATTG
jgi:hypothetical protein